jgi:hypothetical protein
MLPHALELANRRANGNWICPLTLIRPIDNGGPKLIAAVQMNILKLVLIYDTVALWMFLSTAEDANPLRTSLIRNNIFRFYNLI